MDIIKSISFQFEDSNWLMKLAVGGLLGMFSWLILPGILLNGYAVKTAKHVHSGEGGLPEWENIGQIFKDGGLFVLNQLLFLLPVFVPAFCLVAILPFVGGGNEYEVTQAQGIIAALAGILIIIGAASFIVATPVILAMQVEGKLFSLRAFVRLLFSNIGAVLIVAVMIGGLSFLLSLIMPILAITVIGHFLLSFVLAPYTMTALGYIGATMAEPVEKPTDPQPVLTV